MEWQDKVVKTELEILLQAHLDSHFKLPQIITCNPQNY